MVYYLYSAFFVATVKLVGSPNQTRVILQTAHQWPAMDVGRFFPPMFSLKIKMAIESSGWSAKEQTHLAGLPSGETCEASFMAALTMCGLSQNLCQGSRYSIRLWLKNAIHVGKKGTWTKAGTTPPNVFLSCIHLKTVGCCWLHLELSHWVGQ